MTALVTKLLVFFVGVYMLTTKYRVNHIVSETSYLEDQHVTLITMSRNDSVSRTSNLGDLNVTLITMSRKYSVSRTSYLEDLNVTLITMSRNYSASGIRATWFTACDCD